MNRPTQNPMALPRSHAHAPAGHTVRMHPPGQPIRAMAIAATVATGARS
ncbi:MAG TPA: hypothetical protein VFE82_00960 [Ramlibacter sp.]|nr:hypothetical protein [Ramlibacter sp.]HZY17016.1 hypothetical protein [Ramlibacter sp.]